MEELAPPEASDTPDAAPNPAAGRLHAHLVPDPYSRFGGLETERNRLGQFRSEHNAAVVLVSASRLFVIRSPVEDRLRAEQTRHATLSGVCSESDR